MADARNQLASAKGVPRPAKPAGHRVSSRRTSALRAVVALLTLVLAPLAIGAQQPDPARPSPAQPRSVESAAGEGIGLDVRAMGVGGLLRVGDWFGVNLAFRDPSQRPREVILRLRFDDADGDTLLCERVVTSNPDQRQSAWLYARLPANPSASTLLEIDAFEVASSEAGEGSASGRQAGRLLQRLARPVSPQPASVGMILAVGVATAGLSELGFAGWTPTFHPTAHELNRIASTRAEQLPDRWLGLAPFQAVVWTDADPTVLTPDQVAAMREWVRRGGHLVILIPAVGQTWVAAGRENPLSELIPKVTVERREGTALEAYRALLQHRPTAEEQSRPGGAVLRDLGRGTVHVLQPRPDALPAEAMVLLTNADEEPVAVRRLHGVGTVTLVGLDLASPQLARLGLPDAEVIWNRLLGLRGQIDQNPDRTTTSRNELFLDGGISAEIDERGTAATGVFLGLVLFSIYWVLAAPVGFFLLKRRGLTHLSWLAFAATALLFTVIAWSGAALIRPHTPRARHLTVLEHVYGQPVQRARSWLSVMVPYYGDATLSLDVPPGGASLGPAAAPASITPWDGVGPSATAGGKFPDARSYAIDARLFSSVRFPARQTVKQFQVDWSGGPTWSMPRPTTSPGSAPLDEPQILLRAPQPRQPRLIGTLSHELPGPLSDVTIIVSWGQRDIPTNNRRGSLANAEVWRLVGDWNPATTLDLASVTTPQQNVLQRDLQLEAYIETALVERPALGMIGASSARNIFTGMLGSALLSQYPPEDATGIFNAAPVHAQRLATHHLDLGRWLMQPCVIIIAQLGADPSRYTDSPIPLALDGRPLRSRGRTIVRWIYPLPPAAPSVGPFLTGRNPAPTQPTARDPTTQDPSNQSPSITDPNNAPSQPAAGPTWSPPE